MENPRFSTISAIFAGISLAAWTVFAPMAWSEERESIGSSAVLHATLDLSSTDKVELTWIPVGNEQEIRSHGADIVADAENLRRSKDAPPLALITEAKTNNVDGAAEALAEKFVQNGIALEKYEMPTALVRHPVATSALEHTSLRPTKGEIYLGLAQGAIAGVAFTKIYFFSMEGINPELAAGLTVMQATLAASQSIWTRTFDHYFLRNFQQGGKNVSRRTEYFRRIAYGVFLNEIFRALTGEIHGIPPLFSFQGQLNVFTYVALADTGGALLSSARARAFEHQTSVNARFKFLSYIITAPFYFMEANHVAHKTLFNIGFYEFTDTSLMVLMTTLGLAFAAKTFPGKVAWVLGTLVDGVLTTAQNAVQAIQRNLLKASCEALL